MSHGGAREGAGRKHKWLDSEGNVLETKPMRVPKQITKEDIQKILEEKEKNDNKQN